LLRKIVRLAAITCVACCRGAVLLPCSKGQLGLLKEELLRQF